MSITIKENDKENDMPDKTKSLRQHMIRLTLVTGSTVATIIGAQSLATIDKQSLQSTPNAAEVTSGDPASPEAALPDAQPLLAATATPVTIMLTTAEGSPTPTPPPTVVHAAPKITVLRGSEGLRGADGTTSVQQATTNPVVQIAPPSPVEVAPPAPIVIQNTPQVIVQEVMAPPPPQPSSSSSSSSSSSNSAPAPRSSSSR